MTPTRPAKLATLTTRPLSRASIRGSSARDMRTGDSKLRVMVARTSSMSSPVTGRRRGAPALLTRTSMPSSSSQARSASAAAASVSDRSATHMRESGECVRQASRTSRSRSSRRATSPSVAPRSARVVARAAPIPDDAPVIRMVDPATSVGRERWGVGEVTTRPPGLVRLGYAPNLTLVSPFGVAPMKVLLRTPRGRICGTTSVATDHRRDGPAAHRRVVRQLEGQRGRHDAREVHGAERRRGVPPHHPRPDQRRSRRDRQPRSPMPWWAPRRTTPWAPAFSTATCPASTPTSPTATRRAASTAASSRSDRRSMTSSPTTRR